MPSKTSSKGSKGSKGSRKSQALVAKDKYPKLTFQNVRSNFLTKLYAAPFTVTTHIPTGLSNNIPLDSEHIKKIIVVALNIMCVLKVKDIGKFNKFLEKNSDVIIPDMLDMINDLLMFLSVYKSSFTSDKKSSSKSLKAITVGGVGAIVVLLIVIICIILAVVNWVTSYISGKTAIEHGLEAARLKANRKIELRKAVDFTRGEVVSHLESKLGTNEGDVYKILKVVNPWSTPEFDDTFVDVVDNFLRARDIAFVNEVAYGEDDEFLMTYSNMNDEQRIKYFRKLVKNFKDSDMAAVPKDFYLTDEGRCTRTGPGGIVAKCLNVPYVEFIKATPSVFQYIGWSGDVSSLFSSTPSVVNFEKDYPEHFEIINNLSLLTNKDDIIAALNVALNEPFDKKGDAIRKIYKSASKSLHPDKNVGNEAEAQSQFQQMIVVFEGMGMKHGGKRTKTYKKKTNYKKCNKTFRFF